MHVNYKKGKLGNQRIGEKSMSKARNEDLILECPVGDEQGLSTKIDSKEQLFSEQSRSPELVVQRLETSTRSQTFTIDLSSQKVTSKSKRYESILFSYFHSLVGGNDYLIINNVLIFLTAKDLVHFSGTCKYFRELSFHSSLWYRLYHIDFSLNDIESGDHHNQRNAPPTNLLQHLVVVPPNAEDLQQQKRKKKTATSLLLGENFQLRDILLNTELDLDDFLFPKSSRNNRNNHTLEHDEENPEINSSNHSNHIVTLSSPGMDSKEDGSNSPDGPIAFSAATMSYYQRQYITRYQDFHRRQQLQSHDTRQLHQEVKRINYAHTLETVLDITQVRLVLPLLTSSLFLSLILLCQKIDGLNIPYWSCAIPLGFSLAYMVCSLILIAKAEKSQYDEESVWKGLYTNMRGPIVFLYHELLFQSRRLYRFCISLLILMLIQIALVVIKFTQEVPRNSQDTMSWGIVFIPIWMLFFLYCFIPCMRFHIDAGIYIACFFLIWIPFMILFLCMTVKFETQRSMRLALIFIPFYIIEGFFLLVSLATLIVGIQR
jgi:hypothetical protein